jgi:peptidyl-prolyl cis-trans isomerase C
MNYLPSVRITALTAALTALLALPACKPKNETADTAAPADGAIVATVNGEPITSGFFDVYTKGVTGKPAPELPAETRDRALDNVIDAKLIAQQAKKDGLLKDPQVNGMLELARLNVLQQAVSERYLKDKRPTEQELRAEYETQVAALPQTEYHARHVLVATEQFAEKLIGELDKGGNFESIAKRETMDEGSKASGGDLGWFTPDRMVKPFSDAVLGLKKGEYTRTPVKTQYGWHVIKLEDTRPMAAPGFDQVKQKLEQMVLAKKFKAYTDELLKTAKVEKKTPAPATTAPAAKEPAKPASDG